MEPLSMQQTLSIVSPAFQDGGQIPPKYTCDGEGLVPPLYFFNIPQGTESLVLIVDDPDSPAGTWIHWIRFNISPKASGVDEGGEIEGGMGKNTASSLGWQSPCPHQGEHRYYFRLYALSSKLDLPDGVTVSDIEREMDGLVIAKASLMGRYKRI